MKKSALLLLILAIACTSFAQEMDSIAENQPDTNIQFIQENFEIPSYNLYQQDWNHDHVRIKSLASVFGENADIKIILVDNNNPFVAPLRELILSSPYGMRKGSMHTGVDLRASLNDSVFCCFDGVVRMAKSYSGYGNIVVVRHFNGLETAYAHLNVISVKPDQIVNAGDLIGLVGHTGRASGDHLHFETRFLYEHFDPAKMIDFDEEELYSNVLTIKREELRFEVETEDGADAPHSGSANIHVVQQGESLYGIAKKYNVSLEQIYRLNNLSEDSIIHVGQKIKLK